MGGIGLSPILPISPAVSFTYTWIGHRCKSCRTCQITDSGAVVDCTSSWKYHGATLMHWKYLSWFRKRGEERPNASALGSNATHSLILPSSLHIGLTKLLRFMPGLQRYYHYLKMGIHEYAGKRLQQEQALMVNHQLEGPLGSHREPIY